jgi:hypothetical protein
VRGRSGAVALALACAVLVGGCSNEALFVDGADAEDAERDAVADAALPDVVEGDADAPPEDAAAPPEAAAAPPEDAAAPPEDAAAPAEDVDAPPPAFGELPWEDVAFGVAYKDAGEARGEGVLIGYAGYQVTADESRAWVSALYDAALSSRGVRHVYAVQGPAQVQYEAREITNSALARRLVGQVAGGDARVHVAAHSSGSWVACELFEQLFEGGFDPMGETIGRVVYYDLDGVASCLSDDRVNALGGLYFVHAVNAGGASLQSQSMAAGAARWPDQSALLTYDAEGAGCAPGAEMCLHMSLVNTRPHDASGASRSADYTDFEGRPVNGWYVDNAQ